MELLKNATGHFPTGEEVSHNTGDVPRHAIVLGRVSSVADAAAELDLAPRSSFKISENKGRQTTLSTRASLKKTPEI